MSRRYDDNPLMNNRNGHGNEKKQGPRLEKSAGYQSGRDPGRGSDRRRRRVFLRGTRI